MVARSGMTADRLRAFLSHPHGAMPNLALTRAEIDDLISYIETLALRARFITDGGWFERGAWRPHRQSRPHSAFA